MQTGAMLVVDMSQVTFRGNAQFYLQIHRLSGEGEA